LNFFFLFQEKTKVCEWIVMHSTSLVNWWQVHGVCQGGVAGKLRAGLLVGITTFKIQTNFHQEQPHAATTEACNFVHNK